MAGTCGSMSQTHPGEGGDSDCVLADSAQDLERWKSVVRSADGYGGWARQVAEQEKVAFIDLNAITANRYDKLGAAQVEPLFADPHTHTSRAGAELNSGMCRSRP